MDYGRRQLADRLAAEYVLGTLRGPARRRFEALLPSHPVLRSALERWQSQLGPLAAAIPEVAPPDRVWAGVQQTLFGAPASASAAKAPRAPGQVTPWWRRAGLWQSWSALATAAIVMLVWPLRQTPPPAPPSPPIVIVLAANPAVDGGVMAVNFVAGVSADGASLVLRPVGEVAVTAGRALELWAVPEQGAPRSLGLVRGDAATTLVRGRLLQGTAAFAISLEPFGGSPSGAPTGPIIALGKLGT